MSRSDKQVRLSIMVVDDAPEIRSSVGMFLQARGHMVYEAADGFVGVKVLRREAVDIVITDVKMPGMDGFEVLREVKRLSPDTEVIVVTAFSEVEHAFRAMRDGAFDFFTKPFRVEELNASLQRTMCYQGLRREKSRMQARLDRINAESRQRFGLAAIVGRVEPFARCGSRSGRSCGYHGAHLRRDGHGQGAGGAGHPHRRRPCGRAVVPVNCSAVPEALFESEFYGHERGSVRDGP